MVVTLWIVVICAGILTYLPRLSFILFFGRVQMPSFLLRVLRFVPMAVLSAIILPELFMLHGAPDFSPLNPRLLAGLLAIAVAWRTRNVLLTIAIGMVTLWLLQWLIH